MKTIKIISLFIILISFQAESFDIKNLFKSKKDEEIEKNNLILNSELQGLSKTAFTHLIKAKEIAQKKCFFAVFRTYENMIKTENKSLWNINLKTSLTCIQDLSYQKDTINEKNGCTLAAYDLVNGNYTKFDQAQIGYPDAISSKLCANGGFEELLQMKGEWGADVYGGNGGTVLEAILGNRVAEYFSQKGIKILIHSSRLSDSEMFINSRRKFLQEHHKNLQKQIDEKNKNKSERKEIIRKEELEQIQRNKKYEIKKKEARMLYE